MQSFPATLMPCINFLLFPFVEGPAVEARPGRCPTDNVCMEGDMVNCTSDAQCGDRTRCCECDCIYAIAEDGGKCNNFIGVL